METISTNNTNSKTQAPTSTSSSQFSSLLGSTIESIIHELLHSRSIYPPDSFILHRHLGVRCHASRVPQVGGYVAEFLKVSIPSIISGVGDSISMVILEEEVVGTSNNNTNDRGERTGKTTTIERFVFNFQMSDIIGSKEETKLEQNFGTTTIDIEDLQQCAVARDTELATDAKAQLERSMRECLLRVLTLRKRRRRDGEKAENISFKLCLHVAEEKKQLKENNSNMEADDKGRVTSKCKELTKALQQGEWLIPEESSCLFPSDSNVNNSAQKGRLRPLKDIVVPSCGLGMQIEMEVDP